MNFARALRPSWLGYGLCNVAVSLGLLPINLLLLYYLTQIAGIPGALAGSIIALPKVWDALIDPMFGGWVDQVSIRMRRRAPAILISALVFAASLAGIFALPAHLPVYTVAVIAIVLLILSSVAQTAIGVSQYAIATEMTTNSVELSTLLATATIAAQVSSVIASPALPFLVSATGGGKTGYTMMAASIAAVVLAALVLFVLSVRKVPVRVTGTDPQTISIWKSLRKTIGNATFYNLIGLIVCLNGSIVIQLGLLPFANQYVLHGNTGTLALLEGVLGGAVLAGMVMTPFIVRYMHALTAMLIANICVATLMALLLAATYGPLWMTLLGLGLIGAGSGVVGVLIQTAILEAAQKALPDGTVVALGFYLGIMVASMKLGSSAGSFVSGQMLLFVGFVNGATVQSAGAITGIRIGYTLVPCLFVLLATWSLYRGWLRENRSSAPDEPAIMAAP